MWHAGTQCQRVGKAYCLQKLYPKHQASAVVLAGEDLCGSLKYRVGIIITIGNVSGRDDHCIPNGESILVVLSPCLPSNK